MIGARTVSRDVAEAGARQVPDCNTVHDMCAPALASSHILVGH